MSSSGATSTTANFTGTRAGNDSIVVTIDNGHGGHATATALVYVLRQCPPGFTKSMNCSFRFAPAESLFVLDCSLCVNIGPGQGCNAWNTSSGRRTIQPTAAATSSAAGRSLCSGRCRMGARIGLGGCGSRDGGSIGSRTPLLAAGLLDANEVTAFSK